MSDLERAVGEPAGILSAFEGEQLLARLALVLDQAMRPTPVTGR